MADAPRQIRMIDPERPPRITGYKLLPSKHLPGLLSAGTLRIGTASEYRKDEAAGTRGDPRELARLWTPPAGELDAEQCARLVANTRAATGMPPLPADVAAPKVRFAEGVRVQLRADAYLFCYSTKLTKLLVRRMYHELGYDACVEIADIGRLGQLIRDAAPELRAFSASDWPAGRFYIADVFYRRIAAAAIDLPDNHWQDKDLSYRWQNEGRMLWRGAGHLSSFNVNVPAAAHLFKPVDLTPYL